LFAVQQEIHSINTALVAVGELAFRRIATLAIASELNGDQPPEVLRMAFVRARFCEMASSLCGMDDTEQYLVGMLSMLPAMLRQPMDVLTPTLPLRDEVREALNGANNPEHGLLRWVECHERADWKGCDEVSEQNGFDQKEFLGCYADAIVWAEAALYSAS
jgi:EAL and modified HD-GYP domain-containing signal transduction protein